MNTETLLLIIGSIALISAIFNILLYNQVSALKITQETTRKDADTKLTEIKDQLVEQIQDQFFHANQQQYQLFDGFQKQVAGLKYDTLGQLEGLRQELKSQLVSLESKTGIHLEKMQFLVDDKLHKTLDQRLGHSFQLVNESLRKVQSGLGEMQNIAAGVGDLKKVLSNVKTRGVLGEIQLGNILSELLTREQYAVNISTIPNSRNHVEFAIKFPGAEKKEPIWLPIDAKFPMDQYEKLIDAVDSGDTDQIDLYQKNLRNTVKKMAMDIKAKYVQPPFTTDFAILFLPVEGLYAEVARDTELLQFLQSNMKIMIAGPSNLAAFLNSLSIGFRTLAIEKRTSEVWALLETIKNEFGIFHEILNKTQKKLQEASNVIEKAKGKTKTINRKLTTIEQLPESS